MFAHIKVLVFCLFGVSYNIGIEAVASCPFVLNLQSSCHSNIEIARVKGKALSKEVLSFVEKIQKGRQDDDVAADNIFFQQSVEQQNEEALKMFLELLKSTSGWTFVGERDGVSVSKRALPAGRFVAKEDAMRGSKHACVRSVGILEAKPEAVFDLFQDNSRVSEYNEHCTLMKDVLKFKKRSDKMWTKISWASGPKYGPFGARDFCSVVHYRHFPNGSYVVLNRPAYHDQYRPTDKFVRACILLAGQLIEPYGNGQTKLTQIAHVNPGGGADIPAVAWLINNLCAVGPPQFFRKLEKVAMSTTHQIGLKASVNR